MDRNGGEMEFTQAEKKRMIDKGYYFHDKIKEYSVIRRARRQALHDANRNDPHRNATFLPYLREGEEKEPVAHAVFGCRNCNIHFLPEESVEQHHELHKHGANFLCDFCGQGFRTKRERTKHQTDDGHPWPCDPKKWEEGFKPWWLVTTPRKLPKPVIKDWIKKNLH